MDMPLCISRLTLVYVKPNSVAQFPKQLFIFYAMPEYVKLINAV